MGLFNPASWFGDAVGNAGGAVVKDTLNGVGDVAIKLRSAITGEIDPATRAQIEIHLADLQQLLNLGNQKINEIEAGSSSLFISGWRPALGWICNLAVFLYYIPRFILGMFFWSMECWNAGVLKPMPEMGIADILGLVGTLLGSSIIRMTEKKWGVASK